MVRFIILTAFSLSAFCFLNIFTVQASAEQQLQEDRPVAAMPLIEPGQSEPVEKQPAPAVIAPEIAPVSGERKAAPAVGLAAMEWGFLKNYGETADEDVIEVMLPQLSAWLKLYPDNEVSDKALLLKAKFNLKLGDHKAAILSLIRLMQEYPGSESLLEAEKLLSITADKKLSKKEKVVLLEIAKASQNPDKAQRLAFFIEEMAAKFGESFYEPLVAEFMEFFSRFPAYPAQDALQLSLGKLYSQKKEYVQAGLAYEKLIYMYPESSLIATVKKLLGDVLAENIKDYAAAIKVYRDIAAKFPGTPEAWAAYQQLPRLAERQKQYSLAVEVYESIIALYPDKPEARSAFKAEARILREELAQPAEAIAVLNRLADKYKDDSAVLELYLAAEIARKDLKDLDAEIKIYDRIVVDYAGGKEAAKALLTAGEAFGKNKNNDKAKEYYEKILSDYPGDPLAKKAQKYIEALLKN